MLALFTKFKTHIIAFATAIAIIFGAKKYVERQERKEVLREVEKEDAERAINVYENAESARRNNARDERSGDERLRALGYLRD